MPTIAILGTMDTKGEEHAFVAEQIRRRGHRVLVIDVGAIGDPTLKPDVTRHEIAAAAGADLAIVAQRRDRGEAIAIMSKGAPIILAQLVEQKKIDAVISLGGGGGTAIGTAAMRALPIGFPKLMVSTLASGNTAQYVGVKDIVMFPSIVDVAGLNRISRQILTRAAGAICGMVESLEEFSNAPPPSPPSGEKVPAGRMRGQSDTSKQSITIDSPTPSPQPSPPMGARESESTGLIQKSQAIPSLPSLPSGEKVSAGRMRGQSDVSKSITEDKPIIVASMFGNTTDCVQAARKILEAAGYEVLVFHATGTGGRTMESLIEAGLVAGVLDITTTEWADELVGGFLTAGPTRLEAAARHGIPAIVTPGCLDMVNFHAPESVPAQFKGRNFYQHNPQVTLMRTTPEECAQLGKIIAEKLNASRGRVTVLLPLKGISVISAPGQKFHDPAADAALFDFLKKNLRADIKVLELDCNINDPPFAQACAKELLNNIAAQIQIKA